MVVIFGSVLLLFLFLKILLVFALFYHVLAVERGFDFLLEVKVTASGFLTIHDVAFPISRLKLADLPRLSLAKLLSEYLVKHFRIGVVINFISDFDVLMSLLRNDEGPMQVVLQYLLYLFNFLELVVVFGFDHALPLLVGLWADFIVSQQLLQDLVVDFQLLLSCLQPHFERAALLVIDLLIGVEVVHHLDGTRFAYFLQVRGGTDHAAFHIDLYL